MNAEYKEHSADRTALQLGIRQGGLCRSINEGPQRHLDG
jgi:hypothetical protein